MIKKISILLICILLPVSVSYAYSGGGATSLIIMSGASSSGDDLTPREREL